LRRSLTRLGSDELRRRRLAIPFSSKLNSTLAKANGYLISGSHTSIFLGLEKGVEHTVLNAPFRILLVFKGMHLPQVNAVGLHAGKGSVKILQDILPAFGQGFGHDEGNVPVLGSEEFSIGFLGFSSHD
jgi:hypothetical protein